MCQVDRRGRTQSRSPRASLAVHDPTPTAQAAAHTKGVTTPRCQLEFDADRVRANRLHGYKSRSRKPSRLSAKTWPRGFAHGQHSTIRLKARGLHRSGTARQRNTRLSRLRNRHQLRSAEHHPKKPPDHRPKPMALHRYPTANRAGSPPIPGTSRATWRHPQAPHAADRYRDETRRP
jgi:hypothetical protein